ncbi:7-carboxy-7-deazaguanine synthase [Thiohalorhabdus denitrificans]|uniref:7-carboxy-7-deazaguanine synthase n=1 Tax=Thiohalorhabdus denitrificans TaxID=381306 RepID=A0A0P9C8Y8_9GAMM|nr:7-carboxy-7-deazaguanine synthase QueE [Thiohalorhabdus denitrificans]KPV41510.1 7-carboxy-7-deazaguanine synthase [Thiohalorhabdus denitrificans]SCY30035.1 7-carboxy-7-deazaguanine synthase [Thiohalorhabdus denitrificans]
MTSDREERLRISEIFGPTVQGEGRHIGEPTVFVRTGGCDYRCRWCDTLFAVLPEHRGEWAPMDPEEVLAEVDRLAGEPILVSLSGGNPALQPLGGLIAAGHERGHSFTLETQGSVAAAWFAALDSLTLSPKGPSSGHITRLAELEACLDAAGEGPETTFKVVVFDEADYGYARELAANYPGHPFYLQVGNPEPVGEPDPADLMARYRWLVERVTNDRWYAATVLPQLHVLAWGNQRGV